MIYDRLENIRSYKGLNTNLDRAIDFLFTTDPENLCAERIAIDGENVFGFVQTPVLKNPEDAQFEVHRRYIDIQIAFTDGEVIGYRPASAVARWQEFDTERDVGFSDVTDKGLQLPLNAGDFMILFPQDAHMPCLKGTAEKTKKLVLKVLA